MQWHYLKRRIVNFIGIALTLIATAFTLFWLVWILTTLIGKGWQALDFSMLVQDTPSPGEIGGLRNALVGSIMMCLVGVAIGAPIGVLAATWLAEYGRGSKLAAIIRFVNDVLLSAPSIIIGIFVYALIVLKTGGFSGWAGALALGIILIPVVVRTSEDMLLLVPDTLREAAAALGAQRWRLIVSVVYRAAMRGMITGILLGFARISGETAPLLFTALNNQFFSMDMSNVLANLPMMIFQYAMSPYESWQTLAWAGALLITLSILAINLSLRLFWRDAKKGH